MMGRGFTEVYNLKGGIKAWQGIKATGPEELNLDLITGEESPAQMLEIAYALEETLEKFYQTVKEQVRDEAVVALLTNLAAVEESHKKLLQSHYEALSPSEPKVLSLPDDHHYGLMEGGFKFSEFLKKNQDLLKSPPAVLEVAMMIETQALDLYLRFGLKTTQKPTREILYRIADEEKSHLSALGKLLESRNG